MFSYNLEHFFLYRKNHSARADRGSRRGKAGELLCDWWKSRRSKGKRQIAPCWLRLDDASGLSIGLIINIRLINRGKLLRCLSE